MKIWHLHLASNSSSSSDRIESSCEDFDSSSCSGEMSSNSFTGADRIESSFPSGQIWSFEVCNDGEPQFFDSMFYLCS